MYVVRVAGAEAERDLPFGALALAMGTATADLDELPAPQAAALRTALALDTGPPPDRFAVGAATLGVMTRRAERQPLAILLDDAHHLDRPSAEALVFAARRLVADPILVVAALREGEPSPLRAADLPVLAITGLDQAGTADLLRSADTAPWCFRPGGVRSIGRPAGTRWPSSSSPARRPSRRPGRQGRTRWHPSLCRRRSRRGSSGARGRSGRRPPRCSRWSRRRRGTCAWSSAARWSSTSTPGALPLTESAGLVRTDGRPGRLHAPAGRFVGVRQPDAGPAPGGPRRGRPRAAPARDGTAGVARRGRGPGAGRPAADALEIVGSEARGRGAYAVGASALERAARLTDDAVRRADRGVAAAAAAFDAGDTAWALRLLDEATAGPAPPGTRSRAGALRGAITTRSGALDEAWAILVAAAREVAETDPSRALHLVAEAVDVAFYLADGDVARESQRLAESLLDRGVGGSAAAIGRFAVGMAQVLDGQDGSVSLREGFALLGGEDAATDRRGRRGLADDQRPVPPGGGLDPPAPPGGRGGAGGHVRGWSAAPVVPPGPGRGHDRPLGRRGGRLRGGGGAGPGARADHRGGRCAGRPGVAGGPAGQRRRRAPARRGVRLALAEPRR